MFNHYNTVNIEGDHNDHLLLCSLYDHYDTVNIEVDDQYDTVNIEVDAVL